MARHRGLVFKDCLVERRLFVFEFYSDRQVGTLVKNNNVMARERRNSHTYESVLLSLPV